MSGFKQIDTAPYDTIVEVRVGHRWFPAILLRDASLTAEEALCDQWRATTDNYPRSWSEGCCWESNADGNMSDPPEAWRHIATPRQHGAGNGEKHGG